MTAPLRPLIFHVTDVRRLKITPEALATMQSFAQFSEVEPEAGGLLLARLLHDNEHLVIDAVTTPGPTDERGRYSFGRYDPSHQAAADKAWEESKGCVSAWGDWHTHAEPHPTPSPLDTSEWRRAIDDWKDIGDCLFFVIVGTQSVGVWEVSRGGKVRKLAPAASSGGS